MTVEVRTAKSRYKLDSGSGIMVHETEYLDQRARTAVSFVEKWGMALCEFDGEDSAGRQKMKVASCDSVVKRACEMTDLLFYEFRNRGWITDMPTYAEVDEKHENSETA